MFKLAAGYKLNDMTGLEEGYHRYEGTSVIEANVSVEKIRDVLEHFIAIHDEKLFLILCLPVTGDREEPDETGIVVSATHHDVYYLDGCSREECIMILEKYGELLINDGMCHFGFGGHQSHDEIIVDKYNIVGINSPNLEEFDGFFEAHDIIFKDTFVTAWELISKDNPGISEKIVVDGMTVYDLPEILKDQGMYYAETRED